MRVTIIRKISYIAATVLIVLFSLAPIFQLENSLNITAITVLAVLLSLTPLLAVAATKKTDLKRRTTIPKVRHNRRQVS